MLNLPMAEFINAVNSLHTELANMQAKRTNRLNDKSLMIEYALSLEWLLKNKIALPHEEIILKRDCSKIYHYVYDGGSIFYFSSFYYSVSAIKSGDPMKIQQSFRKMNFDIMAMMLNIKQNIENHCDLGYSEDDCFFDRISCCNRAVNYVLVNQLQDYYNPSLYLICNLLQTLILYYNSDQQKYKTQAYNNLQALFRTLNQYLKRPEVITVITSNPQLYYFIYDQFLKCRTILNLNLPFLQNHDPIPPHMNFKSLLRVLTSVINIDLQCFNQLFEAECERLQKAYSSFSLLEKALFVRNVSAYLFVNHIKPAQPLEFELFEAMPDFDFSAFLHQVFELDKIDPGRVTTEQIAAVQRMNDQELRSRFSKTIKGVNPLTLSREASKPHGSFEISDMEVPIPFQGKNIYLCMPFKTGVEIRENTVPVQAAYQIFRPFIEFHSCAVVFVTAKKCSEQLMNYIKKMRDKMNWPIGVIEERTLAALLLYNHQL